jgi:hypothetical protein
MLIQCTKTMLDKLGLPAVKPVGKNAFFDWYASYARVNRRHTVVFMHDLSRYPLVLYGLLAADFKKLPDLFRQALREALAGEGVDQETADRYLQAMEPCAYTRTDDRSATAQLALLMRDLPYLAPRFVPDHLAQTDFSLARATMSQRIGRGFGEPRQRLLAALQQFKANGQTVFGPEVALDDTKVGEKAFVLRVQLACEDLLIWRKIVVPARMTFNGLHRVLQASFNWYDEHLHQFQLLDPDNEVAAESEPDDPFELGLDMGPARELFSERKRLSAYLPRFGRLLYRYDFGDAWLHIVDLEETIENYTRPLPSCLDGAGTAPPEDVGGEPGFLEFLAAIDEGADTQERDEMLEWAKSQDWQPYDLSAINRKLRAIQR